MSKQTKLAPAMPHGALQEVFEGVWFVKGQVKMPMAIPMKISRSMTVVRNRDGDTLTVINSMRLSDQGCTELDKLGRVTHTLRVGGFHGRDDQFYQQQYGAKVMALASMPYRRALDAKVEKNDAYMTPDIVVDANSELPFEGSLYVMDAPVPGEAICRIDREGGILVTGDSLQNTPAPDEYVNWPAAKMMKKMGFYAPCQVGPAWLQFAKPSAAEIRAILDLEFAHVLPGHGDPVIGDAKERYRAAIMGDLKGCHE